MWERSVDTVLRTSYCLPIVYLGTTPPDLKMLISESDITGNVAQVKYRS